MSEAFISSPSRLTLVGGDARRGELVTVRRPRVVLVDQLAPLDRIDHPDIRSDAASDKTRWVIDASQSEAFVRRHAIAMGGSYLFGIVSSFVAGLSLAGFHRLLQPPAAILLALLAIISQLSFALASNTTLRRGRESPSCRE